MPRLQSDTISVRWQGEPESESEWSSLPLYRGSSCAHVSQSTVVNLARKGGTVNMKQAKVRLEWIYYQSLPETRSRNNLERVGTEDARRRIRAALRSGSTVTTEEGRSDDVTTIRSFRGRGAGMNCNFDVVAMPFALNCTLKMGDWACQVCVALGPTTD